MTYFLNEYHFLLEFALWTREYQNTQYAAERRYSTYASYQE